MEQSHTVWSLLSIDPLTGLPQDLGPVFSLGLQPADFQDESMRPMLRAYIPGAVRRLVPVREYFKHDLLVFARHQLAGRPDLPTVTLADLVTPQNQRRIECLDRIRELLQEVVNVPAEEINFGDVMILVGWALQIIYNPEIAAVYARAYRTKPSDVKRLLARLRHGALPAHQEARAAA